MKRDWDIIRKILLACEAAPPGAALQPNDFPDLEPAIAFEHVKLLGDIGYIKAQTIQGLGPNSFGFVIAGLKWDGHDLLQQMRSDTWWAKIKALCASKGVDLSFEVIKALAVPAAMRLLGLAEKP